MSLQDLKTFFYKFSILLSFSKNKLISRTGVTKLFLHNNKQSFTDLHAK